MCECKYCHLSFHTIYLITLDLEDILKLGPPAKFAGNNQ